MTRTPPLPIPKFLTEDWKYVLYSSWLDDCWCSVLMFPLSCHWNLLEWHLGQWAHHRETDQFWSSQATIKEKQKTKHKAQNKWELLRNVPQIQVRCKNCVRATVVRRNMRGLNMQVCTHNIPALKQIYTYCLISSIKKGSYFKKNIYIVIKLYNHIRKTWCTEQQCLVLSIWLWRRKTTWTLSSTLTKFM